MALRSFGRSMHWWHATCFIILVAILVLPLKQPPPSDANNLFPMNLIAHNAGEAALSAIRTWAVSLLMVLWIVAPLLGKTAMTIVRSRA